MHEQEQRNKISYYLIIVILKIINLQTFFTKFFSIDFDNTFPRFPAVPSTYQHSIISFSLNQKIFQIIPDLAPQILAKDSKDISMAYNTLSMSQKYQWVDNNYQPGLFTFYLQEKSLNSPSKKITEHSLTTIKHSKLKSSINLAVKQHLDNRYKTPQSSIARFIANKGSTRLRDLYLLNTSQQKNCGFCPPSAYSTLKKTENRGKEIGSEVKLKQNNLQKFFQYDINKNRAKLFIFKGEQSNYVKRWSRKLSKKNESQNKSQNASADQISKPNNDNFLPTQKKSINSDKISLKKAEQKLNFLQFIVEKNKGNKKVRVDLSRQKIEMALTKLSSFNTPIFDVPTRRVQTER